MKITEAIESLYMCLANFGDAECKFVTSSEGNPAIELHNVDTSTVEAGVSPAPLDAVKRFNARFPTKNIFIPSRN